MGFAQIHPLIVHFPVALLVSGTIFECYGRLQKEESAVMAAWFNLRFGTAWALVTASVGVMALLSMEVRDLFRSFLTYHILFATLTITLFASALITHRFYAKSGARILYFTLLFVGVFSVLATGYFGGELVHRFGVATLQPVE